MLEINLKTKAATQTTVSYNSMCKFGESSLGATSSGIFSIEGYSDHGVQIPALIKSGKFDLGTEKKKRFRFFYFGVQSSGNLKLSVFCDDSLATEYDIPSTSSLISEIRVPISRTIQGRYWQWQVENESGAFFVLHSVKALPLIL